MKSLLNLRYHNRYRSSLINNIRKRPNTRCPKPLCGAPRPRLQLHRAPTVVSRCSTRISYRQYATWSDTKAKLKQYYNMTQEMLTFYRNAAIQIYHNHKTAWPLMQLYMRSIPLSRKDTRFVQRHIRDLSVRIFSFYPYICLNNINYLMTLVYNSVYFRLATPWISSFTSTHG